MIAATAAWLPLADPLQINLGQILFHPTVANWAGTDELGRDVLSRVIFAARSTLVITLGATCLAILLGMVLGVAAGYWGGILDRILGFAIDLFWSVPFVIFVVLIVSIVGVSRLSLILTIGGINWVTSARVIRAESASLRGRDFIRTARAYGFGSWSIAFLHLMPNLSSTLFTLLGYGAVEVLTLETGLAFIGLSLPAPRPTWGGLLAEGLTYFSSAWWLVAFSAIAVTLTLASFQGLAQRFEKTIYRE
jgi:peptide/nickel transport system permease protein